jgi:hypothetical protein
MNPGPRRGYPRRGSLFEKRWGSVLSDQQSPVSKCDEVPGSLTTDADTRKSPGAKAQILLDLYGPAEAVP